MPPVRTLEFNLTILNFEKDKVMQVWHSKFTHNVFPPKSIEDFCSSQIQFAYKYTP